MSMSIGWPAPEPASQLDLNETLQQMVAAATIILVMVVAMNSDKTPTSITEQKSVTAHPPVKLSPLMKPVLTKPNPAPAPTYTEYKSMPTPEIRGRAVGYPRPGWIMKEVLMKERTLYDGAYVSEASVIDLYKTYKDLINKENKLRDKRHKLKGPTLHSFDTHFRFAEYLGLVKCTGYVPMNAGLRRRVFSITQQGIDDEVSWDNLCGAWKEMKKKVTFKMPSGYGGR